MMPPRLMPSEFYIDCDFNGVEKTFDSRKELLDKYFVKTCVISPCDAEYLISSGFLTAPASTKYHGNYSGGLFDHSISVAASLMRMTNSMQLQWMRASSPLRVGLLHDLCKMDQYVKTDDGWTYNSKSLLKEHGIKSVVIAQRLPDTELTEEEIACITYHMGAFVDSDKWNDYTNAIHMYPNVLWTHTADCFSTHVMEVN